MAPSDLNGKWQMTRCENTEAFYKELGKLGEVVTV